jgi:L-alanine-DL-glutamate epimerase-like enolase superfamily enzyme
MAKPTDIRLLEVRAQTERFDYRTPMKFGGRVVKDVVLLHVEVRVETRDGRTGLGRGSMPMGNIWGWPAGSVSPDQTLEAMIRMGRKVALDANDFRETGHPLELTHDYAKSYQGAADAVTEEMGIEPMPRLAQLVAASPFEAAVFDAYGKTLGSNAYNLLSDEFCNRDLGEYLGEDFAGEYLDRYTLREPKPRMPLYHLVGALDPLTEADIDQRLEDGLPETLGEWIHHNGLTHMKIKLNGDDLDWDVDRVCSIDRIAAEAQAKRRQDTWFYSADFNEKCQSVEYVLAFLKKIEERAPEAMQRLQYIEQPTSRDLKSNPDNTMHRAAEIKPVVIDEALVDFESLQLSREQGYSGVALKACKGHGEALLMGAAALKYEMFLCVQDLTCPGASFLHSATLSARIPTVAAIEGNGRQYCPAANAGWEEEYPGMFQITDGTLLTKVLDEPGLGFHWPEGISEIALR